MTALPRTSLSRLAGRDGGVWDSPPEWTPGFVLLDAKPDQIRDIHVVLNGSPLDVQVRVLGGEVAVMADWPRVGPGWYELSVRTGAKTETTRHRVGPSKFSETAFAAMLDDLETRLPVSIAIALSDAGARVAVSHISAGDHTLETEVARLRRAIYGSGRPGLAAVLTALAESPHAMLTNVGEWVDLSRARRVDTRRLVESLWKADNIERGLPRRLVDHRVEHTVDLYENRVLRAFHDAVASRLRRLRGVLTAAEVDSPLGEEIARMLRDMTLARRAATFLDEVRVLSEPPSRVTMVLLRRREYRAAFEGYQEFLRRMSVELDDPRLAEGLKNLPYLYQAWCALQVIEQVLQVASEFGFVVRDQRLVRPSRDGMLLEPLKPGRDALRMTNANGWSLRVVHERGYWSGGSGLHSVSFSQVPDIAIELSRPGSLTSILLLDPKYKLESEDGAEPSDGTPKKVDVDKMHAYRDAIRDPSGRRAVAFAATLYPGKTVRYGADVAAIGAVPEAGEELQGRVGSIVSGWLSAAVA